MARGPNLRESETGSRMTSRQLTRVLEGLLRELAFGGGMRDCHLRSYAASALKKLRKEKKRG
jgi:hypothetical protein